MDAAVIRTEQLLYLPLSYQSIEVILPANQRVLSWIPFKAKVIQLLVGWI